jgi:hypothetical protein
MSHSHKDILRRFAQLTLKENEPLPMKHRVCPPPPRANHSPVFCWSHTNDSWNTDSSMNKVHKENQP